MSDCEQAPRIATQEQRRRMREGKSIYQRDKVVEKYDVKKGKWV